VKIPLISACFLIQLLSGWAVAAQITLHESDERDQVVLSYGDLLQVELLSNLTTGYSWSFHFSRQGILFPDQKPTYRQAGERHPTIGAGALEIWKFRTLRPGDTKLIFSYARPWEKGVPPVRLVKWAVRVRPK
jgi:predicted secreted protein